MTLAVALHLSEPLLQLKAVIVDKTPDEDEVGNYFWSTWLHFCHLLGT